MSTLTRFFDFKRNFGRKKNTSDGNRESSSSDNKKRDNSKGRPSRGQKKGDY